MVGSGSRVTSGSLVDLGGLTLTRPASLAGVGSRVTSGSLVGLGGLTLTRAASFAEEGCLSSFHILKSATTPKHTSTIPTKEMHSNNNSLSTSLFNISAAPLRPRGCSLVVPGISGRCFLWPGAEHPGQ